MFCDVWSENVAVTMNRAWVPLAMEAVRGVISMPTTMAGVTVSVVLPLCPPKLAVAELVPGAAPSALPEASTLATAVSAVLHAAVDVTSPCVLSL